MEDNTNNSTTTPTETLQERLIVRVSRYSLSFSTVNLNADAASVDFEPYNVRSGISMAANLREAYKTIGKLQKKYAKTMVFIDSPALIVPIDQYNEEEAQTFFHHAFPGSKSELVMANVLPDLNAVALYGINKDLHLVINDNMEQPRIVNVMAPVWRYLHVRSFLGTHNKLFGYFHEKRLDIFSFNVNRFRFCNTFDTNSIHDAAYFLLNVWQQLALDASRDELYIVGDIDDKEALQNELRRFLARAYVINPTGDFNRSPVTQIKGMPYDLMTYLVKGR